MRPILLSLTALVLSTACRSDNDLKAGSGAVDATADDVEEDGDTGEEEDFSMYDGATLVIITPQSGDFLPWEEEADFEAVLFDSDGLAMPYEDIYWASSSDYTWAKLGQEFEDDSLDVGIHNITARVELPNGTNLSHTAGGVQVQHDNAGIYAGDMKVSVSMEFEGVPVGTSCIGGATIFVDAYGETATGESTCTIDLLGFAEFDLRHEFEYELDGTFVDGETLIAFDLIGFDLPFASEGSLYGGAMLSYWAGNMIGIADIDGTLDVSRVTRSVELSD
jgi:hypothetical protein